MVENLWLVREAKCHCRNEKMTANNGNILGGQKVFGNPCAVFPPVLVTNKEDSRKGGAKNLEGEQRKVEVPLKSKTN